MLAVSPLRTDLGSVFMRLKLNFAASALKSVPSSNLTPRRSLNTRVFASTSCHDSASPGLMPRFASSVRSGS